MLLSIQLLTHLQSPSNGGNLRIFSFVSQIYSALKSVETKEKRNFLLYLTLLLSPFRNPDLDAIRTYTKGKFGWEQAKCDSLLLPVLKKRQCELDQSRQLTLDSYISFGKLPSLSGGKRKKASKRVETAVKRLKLVGVEELNLSEDESDSDAVDTTPPPPPPRKQVTNQKAARKGKKKEAPEELSPKGNDSPRGSSSSPVKFTKQVIPQRVQAETDKLKNKQKAIEIFKQKGNRKK